MNKLISNLMMMAIAIGCSGSLQAAESGSQAKIQLPPADATPRQLFQQAYKHLAEGNAKDLKRNQRAVTFYRDKIKETGEAKQKEQYQKLLACFVDLVVINETVVAGVGIGRTKPAREAMKTLPEIEAKIQALMGRPLEREWLTFDEYDAYVKRLGNAFKTESPHVKPFYRSDWDQEKVRAAMEEARNKANKEKAAGQ